VPDHATDPATLAPPWRGQPGRGRPAQASLPNRRDARGGWEHGRLWPQ